MAAYATQSERDRIVSWFETDFKQSAMRTTKTARLDDGKVDYSFSVTNNTGFDFGRFAFKVKIINKATGAEIGSSTINAGSWSDGETKNFKSKINIPQDVKSISFVMYSESIDYDINLNSNSGYVYANDDDDYGEPADQFTKAVRGIGEMLSGDKREGGVLGELFGTGGMPETTTVKKTTTTTVGGKTTTKTTTTTRTSSGRSSSTTTTRSSSNSRRPASSQNRSRTSSSRPAYSGTMPSYANRKKTKELNQKRAGKSKAASILLGFGILFAIVVLGSEGVVVDMISYGIAAAACFIASGILKVMASNRSKLIRLYETKVNFNGNTSIDELAAIAGRAPAKVADDLQKMIVDGFFPNAYVDMNNRLLVMTRNGEPIESVEKSAAINKKARRQAARENGVVPSDIDDLIVMTDDTQIKDKLKELRAITRRIDSRIEERPEMSDQVSEFREKYYPEVVRLTDEYNEKIANLDSEAKTEKTSDLEINANPNYLQEQARKIKDQLIDLIDNVTEASENLLEKLHEDDITDITTDIETLKTTLASKGLLDSDFDIKL